MKNFLTSLMVLAILGFAPAYGQDAQQTPQTAGKVEVVKPEDLKDQQQPKAEASKEIVETVPGAIVYVRPFPASPASLAEADYGAFETKTFSWNTSDFKSKGVKSGNNPFCIEVQTHLVVREAGLYQFAVDAFYDGNGSVASKILTLIKLEGNVLTSEIKQAPSTKGVDNRNVGAAKLSPGLYTLQAVCGITLGDFTKEHFTFSLLMKSPSDLSFRAPKADELVLKK